MSNMMTPTTLKCITQIFESEECLKGIQTFEETGDAVKAVVVAIDEKKNEQPQQHHKKSVTSATLTTRSGNTYFNLDSKSWQGGTTTVLTPSKALPSIIEAFEEAETKEGQGLEEKEFMSKIVRDNCLPEPIVQTNLKQQNNQQEKEFPKRTMITRSLSNMSNSDSQTFKKSTNTGGRNTKQNMAGRKRRTKISDYTDDEANLSPEERERLFLRRQRNKEAAARCRKRRVDQTNNLQGEVDQWQAKKLALENEIRALKTEREELEFILASHCQTSSEGLCALGGGRRYLPAPTQIQVVRHSNTTMMPRQPQRQHARNNASQHQIMRQQQQQRQRQQQQCQVVAIKSEAQPHVIVEPVNTPYILPEQVQMAHQIVKVEPNTITLTSAANDVATTIAQPLRRPASLGLAKVVMVQQQQYNKMSGHGVAIDTPSSVIPSLSFETFTSTGLTPTATPVTGFSFPLTSASTPGTLNTPMTTTSAPIGGGSCSTQQRSSESITVSELGSPEGLSLVSL